MSYIKNNVSNHLKIWGKMGIVFKFSGKYRNYFLILQWKCLILIISCSTYPADKCMSNRKSIMFFLMWAHTLKIK